MADIEGPPGPGRGGARRPSRRLVIIGSLIGAGAFGAGYGASEGVGAIRRQFAPDPLRSATVAFTSSRSRSVIDADTMKQLVPGSRVTTQVATGGPGMRQEDFLNSTADWLSRIPAKWTDLATSALLDLWVLTDSLPAAVASWSQHWRFIWPRDAAFCAVALARIGLGEVAVKHLLHLQDLQAEDGSFAARYLPGLKQAPDDRPNQFDSIGLVLWALGEVRRTPGVRVDLRRFAPLLVRSNAALVGHTEQGRALPPASPDYWEVSESRATLGIVAPTLLGLRTLVELAEVDPDAPLTVNDSMGMPMTIDRVATASAAMSFSRTFNDSFIASGLQRYSTSGGYDAAVAYLPATGIDVGIDAAKLDDVRDRLTQPAGGIKPGQGWIFDSASWTPATSLLGLAYARIGARPQAESILDWLAASRTAAGSLPEKVTADDQPVSVAPLSWTAANVILSLDELFGAKR